MDRPTDIAIRAYLIWEHAGRPDGKDLDHWLQAEAELAAEPASQDLIAAQAVVSPTQKKASR